MANSKISADCPLRRRLTLPTSLFSFAHILPPSGKVDIGYNIKLKRLLTLTDEERAAISCRYKHETNPRFRERLHCLLLKLHNVDPGCLGSKKGQRPALTANFGRRRYSVLGGYAVTGEYVGVATDGMVNAQTVICWIDRVEAAFPEAEHITVYVDNTRYFHARLVNAHLEGERIFLVTFLWR